MRWASSTMTRSQWTCLNPGRISAGTRIIGQQEPDTGQLQQIVVNRFQLMRQRIHLGNREAEVGVELVGDAQQVRLQPQPKELAIPVIREDFFANGTLSQLLGGESKTAKPFRLHPHKTHYPRTSADGADRFHPHRLVKERPAQNLAGR